MSTGSPTPFGGTPLTGARVLLFCAEGAPLTLSCPVLRGGRPKGHRHGARPPHGHRALLGMRRRERHHDFRIARFATHPNRLRILGGCQAGVGAELICRRP